MRACICSQRHALTLVVSCVHHPLMDIHSPVLICQGRADHCLCPPASLQNPSSDCHMRSPHKSVSPTQKSKLRATPHQDGALGVQATIEFHLTMDPSASKYESGSTLGLQLPKSHCDMSLAICRHGSKGTSTSKPALKRTFSQEPHQYIQAHGIAHRCSHRPFVSIACLLHVQGATAWKPL